MYGSTDGSAPEDCVRQILDGKPMREFAPYELAAIRLCSSSSGSAHACTRMVEIIREVIKANGHAERRADGYLSRKAQAAWPKALVYCATNSVRENWTLERPELDQPIGLGDSFGAARQAVTALLQADRDNGVQSKCVNALRRCVYAMDLYMDGQEDTNEIVGALSEAKQILRRIEAPSLKKAAP